MLHTVSWMVAREPTARRDQLHVEILASFLVGGIVGGALMGALIVVPAWGLYHLVGSRPGVFVAMAASVAAAYALRAANLWNIPKPQVPSQVPEAWRNIF